MSSDLDEALMDYQLLRFRLDHLCELILGGLLALPDFQREFVWGPAKVVDLLQSVAREWPIGSLLILEGPVEFASKPIDNGPDVHSGGVKYYLLDGQQRITSIFHSVKDLSEYVYYVDFNKILDDSLDEDFVFFQRRKSFDRQFSDLRARAESGIAKISDIYETERFIEWLNCIEDVDRRRDFTKIRRSYLYGINAGVYSVPATVLPRDVNFAALAKIFEGLNTNAVRLTTADLLVAANLPKGVNLRELWSEYSSNNSYVDLLELDLLDVLKTCALIERQEERSSVRGLKQADLIKVDPRVYRAHWQAACRQLNDAADFAAARLGVLNKHMLPSSSNLIALSFALASGCTGTRLAALWCEWVFFETFAQSSHTRLLTELSPPRREEWKNAVSEELLMRIGSEIDVAISKPCGSNSYLLRGVNSIRAASAMCGNPDLRGAILGRREKIFPYNVDTNLLPKKNDLIERIYIAEGASVAQSRLIGERHDQELSTSTFRGIFERLVGEAA